MLAISAIAPLIFLLQRELQSGGIANVGESKVVPFLYRGKHHKELTTLIARQIDEFDEVSNKTLKQYAAEIQEANQTFVGVVQGVAKILAEAEEAMERLLGLSRGVNGVDKNVQISTDVASGTRIDSGIEFVLAPTTTVAKRTGMGMKKRVTEFITTANSHLSSNEHFKNIH